MEFAYTSYPEGNSTMPHDAFSWNSSDWYNTTAAMGASTVPPAAPIQHPSMPIVRFVMEACVSLPIAIMGIAGNLLAFIVLCRQKQKYTTTVLLQALAIADTLVLITSILSRSLRYVGWDAFNRVFPSIFVVLYPCVFFFRLFDTWLTVVMTIDRYIAVCHPLHAQRLCTLRRTYIYLAVIAVATFLFSLPRFFEYELVETGYKQTSLVMTATFTLGYRIVAFFVAMYLVPMALLIGLNIRLLLTLRRAYASRQSMISHTSSRSGGSNSSNSVNRSVTAIVVTIVIVCVLCNVMAMIAHIIWAVQLLFEHLRWLEIARRFVATVSNVLVTFNSAINFVIYCLFSRSFRTGLIQTCHCDLGNFRRLSRRWRRGDRHSDTSASGNTSLTTMGMLLPLRMSSKNNKSIVQNKNNAITESNNKQ